MSRTPQLRRILYLLGPRFALGVLALVCMVMDERAYGADLTTFSISVESTTTVVSNGALLDGKCQQCIKEGRASKVYMGGCMTTLASCGGGFYDEGGNYHAPSPCNTTSCSWQCANGHSVGESWASY